MAERTLQSASQTWGHVIVWKFSTMMIFSYMCRLQRLNYQLCHVLLYYLSYMISYPFDIVVELKSKLLAEQRGIPAGYSIDFTTQISCHLSRFLRIDHFQRMTRPICIAFVFSQWTYILWSLAWPSSYQSILFRDITWFLISIRCMISSVCENHIFQLCNQLFFEYARSSKFSSSALFLPVIPSAITEQE